MKNYRKISINGYPESKIDAKIRACTVDGKIVLFQLQMDETWEASCDGKNLTLKTDVHCPKTLEEFLKYLQQTRLVLRDDELIIVPIQEKMLTNADHKGIRGNCAADGCAAYGGCAAKGGCAADGCAAYGGCAAFGGCAADGCVAYGGCVAKGGCAADGCTPYGGCVADSGCVARGCAADGGCAANVPCAADACAAHACAVDACPVNVNVGPCAVDIPICPIIL